MSFRWAREMGNAIKALFRSRALASEVNSELEQHIAFMTAENMEKGMSRREARREAIRKFGNVERYKEEARDSWGTRLLLDLFRDLKFGLFLLRKQLGTSSIAVVVLALGIGIAVTIFSFVSAFMWPDLKIPEEEKLFYTEWRNVVDAPRGIAQINVRDFDVFREETSDLAKLVAYQLFEPTLLIDSKNAFAERYPAARVSPDFFSVTKTKPLLGNVITSENFAIRPSELVVISHNVWREQFNEMVTVIGKQLRIDGEVHTVVGVMPEGFEFPAAQQLWIPADWSDSASLSRTESPQLNVIGKLGEGVARLELKTRMDSVAKRLATEYPVSNEKLLSVGVDRYILKFTPRGMEASFKILLFLAFLVLAVACMNAFNIVLGRSAKRSFELTVRNSLGATKFNIVRQVVIDGFLLSVLGGLGGLVLANVVSAYISSILFSITIQNLPYWYQVSIDGTVILFVLGVVVFSTLVSSVIPALRVAKSNSFRMLKDSNRTSSGVFMGRLSRFLVGGQIATSAFIVLASILLKDLGNALVGLSLPFDADKVLLTKIDLNDSQDFKEDVVKEAFFSNLKREMEGLPGVEAFAYSSVKDGMFENRMKFEIEGIEYGKDDLKPWAGPNVLTPNAFDLLGLKLLSGRLINDLDTRETAKVCVIGEAMVEGWFPDRSPIGQRIKFRNGLLKDEWLSVVGIVSKQNLVSHLSNQNAKGGVYLPQAQWPLTRASILIRGGNDPFRWVKPLRESIRKLSPGLAMPGTFVTVQDFVDQERSLLNVFIFLFNCFGGLALLLASVGLYSVIAFFARERWKEYGIRTAIGASGKSLVLEVLKIGRWYVVIGILLGLTAGLGAGKVIQSILNAGNYPIALPQILATLAAVLVFSFAAMCFPAWRASKVDPMLALRAD